MGKVSEALEKAVSEDYVVPAPERVKVTHEANPSGMNTDGSGQEKDDLNRREFLSDSFMEEMTRWDDRLRMSTDPASPVAEIFRRLRAKILHPDNGTPPRVILVTSVGPEEGKGFVCANLGVALAQGLEHHALIVDCDLRKPALAKLFGSSNEVGLVDYLKDKVKIEKLIRKTSLPKLSIIPGGKPPKNPAELLDSKLMVALVDELKTRYDDRFILFDTPPNIVASETSILAQKVDGVVLVVRWGGAGRDQVRSLVNLIGKEKIIGIVFNAFEENMLERYLKKKGYKYDSYYSYSNYK